MEHRYSRRHVINMKVIIYKSGLPMATGWLRNVCRQGLFVASECDDVALNQLLEIEFLGDGLQADSHRRCRALVAHKTAHGFGLVIDEDSATSNLMLDEMIVRSRQRAAAFAALFDLAKSSAEPVRIVG